MKLLRLAVPAGIGDVSWIWSKIEPLTRTGEVQAQIFVPHTWPQRTYSWLKLLPGVLPAIGRHDYPTIQTEEMRRGYVNYSSWEEVTRTYEEGEAIYLQPNQWFLDGRSLLDWIPDLETNFHYKMNIDSSDRESALKKVGGNYEYTIGIHMASIAGAMNWKCWMAEDWVKLVELLHKEFPGIRFVLVGGYWDQDMAMDFLGRINKDVEVVDLIGKTKIGEIVSILDSLTYYIGFSSGLNVMRNVLDKPCTTMWPLHQKAHIYPHADPRQVEEKSYLGFVYTDPERIFFMVRDAIKKELQNGQAR